MIRRTTPFLILATLFAACGTEPDPPRTEEWIGTVAADGNPLAATADTDDLRFSAVLEYSTGYDDPYRDKAFRMTLWIGDIDVSSGSGCDIDFLPDDGWPCRIMVSGEGLRTHNVFREHIHADGFALPGLGACSIAGRVLTDDEYDTWWHADLRCGDDGERVYSVDFTRYRLD